MTPIVAELASFHPILSPIIHICGPTIYEFKGWTFEFSPYRSPPWPLTKDGELFKRAGDKFYAMFAEWDKLTDEEKAATRIGGGCMTIGGSDDQ